MGSFDAFVETPIQSLRQHSQQKNVMYRTETLCAMYNWPQLNLWLKKRPEPILPPKRESGQQQFRPIFSWISLLLIICCKKKEALQKINSFTCWHVSLKDMAAIWKDSVKSFFVYMTNLSRKMVKCGAVPFVIFPIITLYPLLVRPPSQECYLVDHGP